MWISTTLERWLPYTPVLEQQYIAGKGIGIELLFNRGEKVWHFAHERLHEYPLTGGASTYRRSIAAPAEMLAASELLLTELAWHGVAMVEFKLPRNGDFALVEINPRLWGSLALAIDAGVNFPVGLLQLARDGSLAPQHHYRLGYYTRDLPRDLVWMTENVRADHRNALLLTRHRFRSFFEYLRPLIGKESWDHFDPRDLGVTWALLAQIFRHYSGVVRRMLRRQVFHRYMSVRHARILKHWRRLGRPPRRLLFLCHGNICRSPFALRLGQQSLPDIETESAGFHMTEHRGTPSDLQQLAKAMGIDLSNCSSRYVTAEQVEKADLILLMDSANFRQLANDFPQALGRATMLGLFSVLRSPEIADPYGFPAEDMRTILEELRASVEGLAKWVKQLQGAAGHR